MIDHNTMGEHLDIIGIPEESDATKLKYMKLIVKTPTGSPWSLAVPARTLMNTPIAMKHAIRRCEHKYLQMQREEGVTEDPRKTALEDGLRQLRPHELERLVWWIESGNPVLLDRDEYGHANYSRGTYCPLAIAVRVPVLHGYLDDRDADVAETLTKYYGFKIYNTRGIAGEFYTTNRREDLLTAAREVLAEKESV